MAVNLTTLFTRVGHILGIVNSINTYRGTTLPPKVDTLSGDYNGDQDYAEFLYQGLTGTQAGMAALISTVQQTAIKTIIEMVALDNPQAGKDLFGALRELIRQMVASVDSVNASAPSAGSISAGGTNNGNGNLVYYRERITFDGFFGYYNTRLENLLAEDVTVMCSADSFSGGATAGQERFNATGEFAQGDPLAFDWPRGSGASADLTCIDADVDSTVGNNLLKNSNFEDFTSNTPDFWTVVTGTPGTSILMTTDAYKGTNALRFKGDGAELTEIKQQFGNASGTSISLTPLSLYYVNLWMKKSAGLAGGVLKFRLIDGSSTVIADDAGVNQETSFTLTSLTTSYAANSFFFKTPRVFPDEMYLSIILTTAVTNNEYVYLDQLALARAVPLYPDGPPLAVFSGATAFALGDEFKLTLTNTAGGFQRGFDRLFDMKGLGLMLPSNDAGAETILDSLIS